ncbi:MAG TPA: beta-propeller fold lactonase family protein [Ignavibacteriaceae bacterium]|nr:beta-propeller fold lactonase family protein [Ignavibacteriaceae bacterium]
MKYTSFLSAALFVLVIAFAGCQKNMDVPTGVDSDGITSLDRPGNADIFAVVTESNSDAGNEVVVYSRGHDGMLSMMGSYSTGGTGTGMGLGSQGAVALNGGYIYAVNAGSNDISVLSADGAVVDQESSGGEMPISLTIHHNLLYVLNAGGDGNITGFRINNGDGSLTMISGSSRSLSGSGVGPAQVEFSPNGRMLVVTEKGTNMIDTYTINPGGTASGPNVQPSVGNTPFGFEFDNKGHLIVSDAFGGGMGAGAMSSYDVSSNGISLISGPVVNTQTAPCWVVVTNDGRYSYTTNTGTSNISGYNVNPDGSITLFDDGGNTASTGTGSSPIDMALNNNSGYLYALSGGTHTISVFIINRHTGGLTPVQTVTGLPDHAAGLAAN